MNINKLNKINTFKKYCNISRIISLVFLTANLSAQTVISGGPENDIIGRICRTGPEQMIAIIERNPDWGSGDLYAKFGNYNGTDWGDLIPVVTKPGNQSTHSIVNTEDDSLRVYYASDETGTYKIYTIASLDGVTWVNDQQINLGWPTYQGIYDPHVIVGQDGSMTITYVKFGGGGYVAHCESINEWDQNKTLIQQGAYRIRICVHPYEGYLAAYHRNMGSNQYEVNVKTSTDLLNWSDEVQLTNSGNSHDAFCGYVNGEYWVYYASYKNGAYNLFRQTSSDGIQWLYEDQITFDNTNNTQPAFFIDLYTGTIALNLVWTHAINYDTDNDIYFERYLNVGSSEYIESQEKFQIIQLSHQQFLLKLPSGLSGRSELSIFNMQGQLIERKVLFVNGGDHKVGLELKNSGIYLFNLKVTGKVLCKKVFIK